MIVFNNMSSGLTEVHYQGHSIKEVHSAFGKVWPTEPPIPPYDYSHDYLTFVAKESGEFKFGQNIYYSLDSGSTWVELVRNTNSPTVQSGNTIMWKANYTPTSLGLGIGHFSSSANFSVQGNVMSLLYGDNFSGQTSLSNTVGAFRELFTSLDNLISAENLVLPITLSNRSFYKMFYDCEHLIKAPVLSASTLADSCYELMFSQCLRLTNITCLATDISATDCTKEWVDGLPSNGTFVKAASMNDWTIGINGIPSGWNVINHV